MRMHTHDEHEIAYSMRADGLPYEDILNRLNLRNIHEARHAYFQACWLREEKPKVDHESYEAVRLEAEERYMYFQQLTDEARRTYESLL